MLASLATICVLSPKGQKGIRKPPTQSQHLLGEHRPTLTRLSYDSISRLNAPVIENCSLACKLTVSFKTTALKTNIVNELYFVKQFLL